jgi:hypothetical protein
VGPAERPLDLITPVLPPRGYGWVRARLEATKGPRFDAGTALARRDADGYSRIERRRTLDRHLADEVKDLVTVAPIEVLY